MNQPLPEDLPDTSLLWRWVWKALRPWAGWVLVAVGVLAIILGYWGVANHALVAKQLPYLVSGAVLGIGLIILGIFYLATEELRRDSGRLDRLEGLVSELHAVLLARPDAPDAPDPSVAGPASRAVITHNGRTNGADPDRLVALPVGQRYHRTGCRMVAGKPDVSDVTPREIRRRRLRPCAMCEAPELVHP
jgi:hypothetical protein